MKILITGAAGFIGYSLSLKLLKKELEVIGIDNHNNYYDPNLKEARKSKLQEFANYHHYRIDISHKDSLNELLTRTKPTVVVNLAAQAGVRYSIENPHAYINSNINGFLNMIHY